MAIVAAPAVPLPTVGDFITSTDQVRAMPIGSVIRVHLTPDRTYTKINYDEWSQGNTGIITHHDGDFSLRSYNVVASYPAVPVALPLADTELRYRWKFRQHVLRAQADHGVSDRAVNGALDRLGAGRDAFTLGAGLLINDRRDVDALPRGSVFVVGRPETLRGFGVWALRTTGWTQLLGENTGLVPPGRIEQYGDDRTVPGWLTDPATPEDEARIRAFKAMVWKVGWRVKEDQGWCGTYETVLRTFGIDASAEYEAAAADGGSLLGRVMRGAEAMALPLGSVLRWQATADPVGRQGWFVRSAASSNQCGTRLLFGWRNDGINLGGFANRMTVMYHADGSPMLLDVDMARAWDYLPAGTVVAADGDYFVMARDHRLRQHNSERLPVTIPRTGNYTQGDWERQGLRDMRVTAFPVV